jgi:hypothetical protein
MRSGGTHFAQSGKRRAAVRYFVSLRVEIWPEPPTKGMHPSFFTTSNVSTQGFYFLSSQLFDVGTQTNFRIIFPRELRRSSRRRSTGHLRDGRQTDNVE